MAAISRWRAWYERNYEETVGGTFKKEKKELNQIQSLSDDYPNAYFTWNYFNVTRGYFSESIFAGYKPGDVFLKNFYTIDDMFTSEEIETFCQETMSDFAEHTEDNFVRFKTPNKIFWSGPVEEGQDFGMFLVPFMSSWQEGLGTNPNTIEHDVGIGFGFLVTKWNPRYLGWNWVDPGSGLTYQNQPLINGTDYTAVDGDAWSGQYLRHPQGQFFFYASNADGKELQAVIDNYKAFIKKIKCYPIFPHYQTSKTHDGVKYLVYPSNTTYPTVTPGYNTIRMLYDVSECPFTPSSGFMIDTQAPYWSNAYDMRDYHGFIVEVVRGESPDPTTPDDKDDPNDDDPGPGDDEGGDGDHDDDTDPVPTPGVPNISGSGVGLFTIFNPTFSQLVQLGKKLWNPNALDAIKQYFSNPMEAVIGLGIVPVQPKTASSANIHLGLYDTEIAAPVVDSDYVIKDCGVLPITRYYGSYLDYDPYTKISLYLPYIGEIDIDPDQVMQTNLGVKYYVNVVSGDIVAMITANDVLIYTVAGNCMRQLPIAQRDYSAIISTAVSAVTTIASAGVASSAAKAVQGTVAGGAKSEAGRAIADARANASINNSVMGAGSSLIDQVMSTKMRYHHAGDIGTGSGQLTYQTPYLTIERPNLMLASNYKSYVGYPCNQTLKLNNCKGFTQIEATRLSVPGASDEEINEILQHLVEGVII